MLNSDKSYCKKFIIYAYVNVPLHCSKRTRKTVEKFCTLRARIINKDTGITFHRCQRMFAIAVIIVVIGTIISTLIKVAIDEGLLGLNMKRLSLKRDRNSRPIGIDNASVESLDNSFDSLSNTKTSVEYEKPTNMTDHAAAIINCSMDTSNCKAIPDSSEHACDSYIDLSNDDDDISVIGIIPPVSKKKQPMFKWNSSANNSYNQNISFKNKALSDSINTTKVFEKSCSKRRKNMTDLTISDDLTSMNDSEKEALPSTCSAPEVAIQHDIMIAGVKVKFPAKPYPCQIAVMNSLIQGCTKKQNCLLESPTGSGKTLALLCGVLAWQEQFNEENHGETGSEMGTESACCGDDGAVDNLFLKSSRHHEEECCDKTSCKTETRRVPKVYYGTRTHKQIEQVVRELKKTAYRHKRMTILSSRDYTCIQDTTRNKNELCNELLDPKKPKKCPYYNEKNKKDLATFEALSNYGVETPWDIEDLVSLGHKIEVCPYFAARSLMANADIIFCPYNYIVNPNIRESMQINLKDSIVILDEAHNIEDTCREASGVNLKDDELMTAVKECQTLSQFWPPDCDAYNAIQSYLLDVIKFLKNVSVKETRSGNQQEMVSDYWLGSEFLVLLDMDDVGQSRFPTFLAASKTAIEKFNDMSEEMHRNKITPTISRETKMTLEHLCYVIEMITSENFVNDYRVCITESVEFRNVSTVHEDSWISTENARQKVRNMKLICMNPAVVFASMALAVRSVILASGTLTPTSSFQSELGARFPHVLNANHIIPKEQIYVRCIPRGPAGRSLIANYENINSWTFQDELGDLIVQVCRAVPRGVLCFFSSYNAMYKLQQRWKSNGTWRELEGLKKVFTEPRENAKLSMIMKNYRDTIKSSSLKPFQDTSGAILFAVFRGKVAEGIDFRDDEARCVLAVGIPYSNATSAEISMKMKYNDSNVKTKGLLPGSEWYTINAFRALNQALGRCIRHINDWGAVLLLDERFQRPRNINYLPKWIRAMWIADNNYNLQVELEDFVSRQFARKKGENYIKTKGLQGHYKI